MQSKRQSTRTTLSWLVPAVTVTLLVGSHGAGAAQTSNPDGFGLDYDAKVPPGRTLYQGDMLLSERQVEQVRKLGGFDTNFWPNGVVPYQFDTNSLTAVNSIALNDVVFNAGSPPTITSVTGGFATAGLQMNDEIRVSGSSSNDNNNAGNAGYIATAVTNNTITLTAGDGIVNESAGSATVFSTRTVTAANQTQFVNGVAQWEAVANVDFRPRNGESDYVLVWNSAFNRSDVGIEGNQQNFQMRTWQNLIIIAHEAAHTLGVKHEQSRPDRGTYVTINTQNISQTACSGGPCNGNFNIGANTLAYPTGADAIYDFDSMMHYSRTAFSANGSDTITVKAPWNAEWQSQIGQRNHLSYWDVKTMSLLYPYSNWVFLHASTTASPNDGGFLTPHSDWNTAVNDVPAGGRLVVLYPDTYAEPGVYDKAMVVEAPVGGVIVD